MTLCVGEESSESCLLLTLIAAAPGKVLKEKVLILFERFFPFSGFSDFGSVLIWILLVLLLLAVNVVQGYSFRRVFQAPIKNIHHGSFVDNRGLKYIAIRDGYLQKSPLRTIHNAAPIRKRRFGVKSSYDLFLPTCAYQKLDSH